MNGPLRVGSLFSGIGGFDLGLERAGGFETAWFCEQDEFCQRVLTKHWPGVPCYPDITQLSGADVEPVDVLCGGFPCQDLSLAGKGAGITGARSGLWSEYARLIGELRPRYVIVENVPALLGRGLGRVLGDLAALGFDAEWDCLPASAFGAPHRRDRFWLVAYPNGDARRDEPATECGGGGQTEPRDDGASRPVAYSRGERPGRSGEGLDRTRRRSDPATGGQVMADSEGVGRGPRWEGRPLGDGQDGEVLTSPRLADTDDPRRCQQRWPEPSGSELTPAQFGGGWPVEPALGRVVDGFPGRVDQLRALGNALVPQIAEWIGRRLMTASPAHTTNERNA